ncbi:hypothetical protein PLESTB_000941300 [Pleodorina starrii]|uniref:FAD dependent oxidoreductase n=1 Tax=Pleodorina starrii TaxID=330485 RepID=A0A9W6F3Q5_9CHLO|nr:hypothetical protein PLESTM_000703900 [Pleodorina starrii]GLC55079.1 hypothetical protein PLESTB_000941300 [Pleodorina starrii]GLC71166.1 hypothetical protein PLESTF_001081600 [Pleodorina starrii]
MKNRSLTSGAQLAPLRGCKRPCKPCHSQHRLDVRSVRSAPTRVGVACKSAPAASSVAGGPSLTERIFAQVDALAADAQAQGAGGRTTYAAFQAAEQQWARIREGPPTGPAPRFVTESPQPLAAAPEFDVVVCGGTLGIFSAAALARRGLRVAVLERGPLRGRAQEWNISRKELLELEHVGVATREELEACVAIEFNPVRVGFAWRPDRGGDEGASGRSSQQPSSSPSSSQGAATKTESTSTSGTGAGAGTVGGGGLSEVWTRDVLNLGVSPNALIALMRRKLEEMGGVVLDRTALEGIQVHPNGCSLAVRPEGGGGGGRSAGSGSLPASASASSSTSTRLTTRLVVDCMGHFSPIVTQVRWGSRPDGVCLVVGSLGSGFTHNSTADVILTNTPLQPEDAKFNLAQYFWEAFPASSGPTDRTTYLFTYLTADSYRPSLAAMLDDYWNLMPQYQGVRLEDITFKRLLFGFFPTFKDTPLRPAFDRVIQIGDASGLQSPLSFGGFGALTRHLARLTRALAEALECDALDRGSLALVHCYNPGLSSSWMMQKAMSVRKGEQPPPELINRMLAGNFKSMERLGNPVMKPFLQDVIQFGPMVQTLTAQMLTDPASIPGLIAHVGPGPLLEWMGHMASLGAYTALHGAASAARLRDMLAAGGAVPLTPRERFAANRLLDAWEYGSGQDYKL